MCMARPEKLDASTIDSWLAARVGWTRAGEALTKRFSFADFGASMAFAVRVGFEAEKRDHHPDLTIAYGRADVLWTTHDAGGITALDLTLAERCDELAR